jgi:hypothetical protein
MQEFRLTSDHLKLLKHAYVGWNDCEFGAPEIDPKRPYGNKDVIRDIVEILGIVTNRDDDGCYMPSIERDLGNLHRETETALQIVLRTGSFLPGLYRCEPYTSKWQRVGD